MNKQLKVSVPVYIELSVNVSLRPSSGHKGYTEAVIGFYNQWLSLHVSGLMTHCDTSTVRHRYLGNISILIAK